MPEINYTFNRDESDKLADAIRKFWKAKGHDVRAETVEHKTDKGQTAYGIRTSLMNGLPQGAAR